MCLQTGTFWPWTHIIHDVTQKTVLGTIFHFEHVIRELPVDILLGVSVAASVRFFYPPDRQAASSDERGAKLFRLFVVLTIATIVVIVVGGALAVGWRVMLLNLAQMPPTHRILPPLTWGAHWQFHLLDRVALMLLGVAIVGMYRAHSPAGVLTRSDMRRGTVFLWSVLGVFGALTLVFRPAWEPFLHSRYLYHEALEIVTHGSVTLPLAIGTCLWLAGWGSSGAGGEPAQVGRRLTRVAGVIGVLVSLYTIAGAVITGAQDREYTLAMLTFFFPHFFEHGFTYLVVPFTAGLGYLWLMRRSTSS